MKKYLLVLSLYVSVLVVAAFDIISIIHLITLPNRNVVTLVLGFSIPFGFIVSFAILGIEEFLRY